MRLLLVLSVIIVLSCNSKKEPEPADVWNMVERRAFSYALNGIGTPDTVFVLTQKFKDNIVIDSSKAFYSISYKNDKPTNEAFYEVDKNGTDKLIWTKAMTYTAKGSLSSSVISQNGRLIKKEVYGFDTGNKMKSYMLVADLNASSNNAPRLDTVRSEYTYNATGNMTAARSTNRNGELMSKDTFGYYSAAPLFYYRIAAKGDTLERTSYKQEGKTLVTQVENDSMIFKNHTIYNLKTGQIAIDKRTNQKFKLVVKYSPDNRKTEELVYETVLEE